MKIIKLADFLLEKVGLASKASSSAAEELGTAIDLAGQAEFYSGLVVTNIGAATGTPDSFSVVTRLLECDTSGGSYTAVTGATVTQTAAGVSSFAFNPASVKRYVKVGRTVTITGGTTPTVPTGAVVLFGDPKYGPQ